MENNSDKPLRDKLNSNEFPFDPQAWAQMETMLDDKKKRPVLFWWAGGIAAALFFGILGYELRGLVGNEQLAEDPRQKTEDGSKEDGKTVVTLRFAVGNENPETSQKSNEGVVEKKGENDQALASRDEKIQPANNHGRSISENTTANKNGDGNEPGKRNKKNIAQGKGQKLNKATKAKTDNENGFQGFAHNSSKPNGAGPRSTATVKGENKRTVTTANSQVTISGNPYQNEVEMLNTAAIKKAQEENISLASMGPSLLEPVSETAATFSDKKGEEETLPKRKKKIFQYSVGAMANVTGTTLGKQAENTSVPNHLRTFDDQPSYMVGFTQDFLFVNRVALTTSFAYARTSFVVTAPRAETFPQAPTFYSSKIQEFVIPVGIKVYPVAKSNFKFYINTGIINHIKLKESFDYRMPPYDPSSTPFTGNAMDPVLPRPYQPDLPGPEKP